MSKNKKVFKACGCSPPYCPEIELSENIDGVEQIIITDDYNGTIVITKDEFELMIDWYKDISKNVATNSEGGYLRT